MRLHPYCILFVFFVFFFRQEPTFFKFWAKTKTSFVENAFHISRGTFFGKQAVASAIALLKSGNYLAFTTIKTFQTFGKFCDWKQVISAKKQIASLCKLYSFSEEKPEKSSKRTDKDSISYHNNFDFYQSQRRLARVSKKLQQKNFCNQILSILRFQDRTLDPL